MKLRSTVGYLLLTLLLMQSGGGALAAALSHLCADADLVSYMEPAFDQGAAEHHANTGPDAPHGPEHQLADLQTGCLELCDCCASAHNLAVSVYTPYTLLNNTQSVDRPTVIGHPRGVINTFIKPPSLTV